MMLLRCPWCGHRNVTEFHHHGEATPRPDVGSATPAQWRRYLYLRANPAGWVDENWYHAEGCRRFIRIRRHTLTNENHPAQSYPAEGTR